MNDDPADRLFPGLNATLPPDQNIDAGAAMFGSSDAGDRMFGPLGGRPVSTSSPDAQVAQPQGPLSFDPKMEKNLWDAFDEVRKNPLHYVPYLNAVDLIDSGRTLMAARAYQAGTATPDQMATVQNYLAEQSRPETFGYKVVSGLLGMIPFMGEIAGAVGTLGGAAAFSGAKAAGKQGAKLALEGTIGGILQKTMNLATRGGATKWAEAALEKSAGSKLLETAATDTLGLWRTHMGLVDDVAKAAMGTPAKALAEGELAKFVAGKGAAIMTQDAAGAAVRIGTKELAVQAAKRVGTVTGLYLAETFPSSIINPTIQRMIPEFQLTDDQNGHINAILANEGDGFFPALAKSTYGAAVNVSAAQLGDVLYLGHMLWGKGVLGKGMEAVEKMPLFSAPFKGAAIVSSIKETIARGMGSPGVDHLVQSLRKAGWEGYWGNQAAMVGAGLLQGQVPSFGDLAAQAVSFAAFPAMIGANAFARGQLTGEALQRRGELNDRIMKFDTSNVVSHEEVLDMVDGIVKGRQAEVNNQKGVSGLLRKLPFIGGPLEGSTDALVEGLSRDIGERAARLPGKALEASVAGREGLPPVSVPYREMNLRQALDYALNSGDRELAAGVLEKTVFVDHRLYKTQAEAETERKAQGRQVQGGDNPEVILQRVGGTDGKQGRWVHLISSQVGPERTKELESLGLLKVMDADTNRAYEQKILADESAVLPDITREGLAKAGIIHNPEDLDAMAMALAVLNKQHLENQRRAGIENPTPMRVVVGSDVVVQDTREKLGQHINRDTEQWAGADGQQMAYISGGMSKDGKTFLLTPGTVRQTLMHEMGHGLFNAAEMTELGRSRQRIVDSLKASLEAAKAGIVQQRQDSKAKNAQAVLYGLQEKQKNLQNKLDAASNSDARAASIAKAYDEQLAKQQAELDDKVQKGVKGAIEEKIDALQSLIDKTESDLGGNQVAGNVTALDKMLTALQSSGRQDEVLAELLPAHFHWYDKGTQRDVEQMFSWTPEADAEFGKMIRKDIGDDAYDAFVAYGSGEKLKPEEVQGRVSATLRKAQTNLEMPALPLPPSVNFEDKAYPVLSAGEQMQHMAERVKQARQDPWKNASPTAKDMAKKFAAAPIRNPFKFIRLATDSLLRGGHEGITPVLQPDRTMHIEFQDDFKGSDVKLVDGGARVPYGAGLSKRELEVTFHPMPITEGQEFEPAGKVIGQSWAVNITDPFSRTDPRRALKQTNVQSIYSDPKGLTPQDVAYILNRAFEGAHGAADSQRRKAMEDLEKWRTNASADLTSWNLENNERRGAMHSALNKALSGWNVIPAKWSYTPEVETTNKAGQKIMVPVKHLSREGQLIQDWMDGLVDSQDLAINMLSKHVLSAMDELNTALNASRAQPETADFTAIDKATLKGYKKVAEAQERVDKLTESLQKAYWSVSGEENAGKVNKGVDADTMKDVNGQDVAHVWIRKGAPTSRVVSYNHKDAEAYFKNAGNVPDIAGWALGGKARFKQAWEPFFAEMQNVPLGDPRRRDDLVNDLVLNLEGINGETPNLKRSMARAQAISRHLDRFIHDEEIQSVYMEPKRVLVNSNYLDPEELNKPNPQGEETGTTAEAGLVTEPEGQPGEKEQKTGAFDVTKADGNPEPLLSPPLMEQKQQAYQVTEAPLTQMQARGGQVHVISGSRQLVADLRKNGLTVDGTGILPLKERETAKMREDRIHEAPLSMASLEKGDSAIIIANRETLTHPDYLPQRLVRLMDENRFNKPREEGDQNWINRADADMTTRLLGEYAPDGSYIGPARPRLVIDPESFKKLSEEEQANVIRSFLAHEGSINPVIMDLSANPEFAKVIAKAIKEPGKEGSERDVVKATQPEKLSATPTKKESMPRKENVVSIIGTAGRDKTKTMTKETWEKMYQDAARRVQPTDTLVSGGAAWADHLAVKLYLEGKVANLTLHLPAPFKDGKFEGGYGTSGGAANYYHEKFSAELGINTRTQIERAILKGAKVTEEPVANGYDAMKNRNSMVAKESTHMLAYTHGEGNRPADGGTMDTWNKASHAQRQHVPIQDLGTGREPEPLARPPNEAPTPSQPAGAMQVPPVAKKAASEVPAPLPVIPKRSPEELKAIMDGLRKTYPMEDWVAAHGGRREPVRKDFFTEHEYVTAKIAHASDMAMARTIYEEALQDMAENNPDLKPFEKPRPEKALEYGLTPKGMVAKVEGPLDLNRGIRGAIPRSLEDQVAGELRRAGMTTYEEKQWRNSPTFMKALTVERLLPGAAGKALSQELRGYDPDLQHMAQQVYKGVPIHEVEPDSMKHKEGFTIGARMGLDQQGKQHIWVDRKELQRQADDRQWLHPRMAGVDPLPVHAPDGTAWDAQKWTDFVMEHEYQHSIEPRLAHESDAAYENRINDHAWDELASQASLDVKTPDHIAGDTYTREQHQALAQKIDSAMLEAGVNKAHVEKWKDIDNLDEQVGRIRSRLAPLGDRANILASQWGKSSRDQMQGVLPKEHPLNLKVGAQVAAHFEQSDLPIQHHSQAVEKIIADHKDDEPLLRAFLDTAKDKIPIGQLKDWNDAKKAAEAFAETAKQMDSFGRFEGWDEEGPASEKALRMAVATYGLHNISEGDNPYVPPFKREAWEKTKDAIIAAGKQQVNVRKLYKQNLGEQMERGLARLDSEHGHWVLAKSADRLEALSPTTWCTSSGSAEQYASNYDNWLLRVDGKTVAGAEISTETPEAQLSLLKTMHEFASSELVRALREQWQAKAMEDVNHDPGKNEARKIELADGRWLIHQFMNGDKRRWVVKGKSGKELDWQVIPDTEVPALYATSLSRRRVLEDSADQDRSVAYQQEHLRALEKQIVEEEAKPFVEPVSITRFHDVTSEANDGMAPVKYLKDIEQLAQHLGVTDLGKSVEKAREEHQLENQRQALRDFYPSDADVTNYDEAKRRIEQLENASQSALSDNQDALSKQFDVRRAELLRRFSTDIEAEKQFDLDYEKHLEAMAGTDDIQHHAQDYARMIGDATLQQNVGSKALHQRYVEIANEWRAKVAGALILSEKWRDMAKNKDGKLDPNILKAVTFELEHRNLNEIDGYRELPDNATILKGHEGLVQEVRAAFDKAHADLTKAAQTFTQDRWIRYLQDYMPHLWASKDGVPVGAKVAKWAEETARNKERRIPTYADGIAMGLTPVSLDAADLYQKYINDAFKVSTNRQLLHLAQTFTDNDGNPLVVGLGKDRLDETGPHLEDRKADTLLAVKLGKSIAGMVDDNIAGSFRSKLAKPFKALADVAAQRDLHRKYETMASPYESWEKFLVHPDAANTMKMLLNEKWDNSFWNGVEHFNNWSKALALSFSAFHYAAVTESYWSAMAHKLGDEKTKVMRSVWEGMTGELRQKFMDDPASVEEAVRSGLKFAVSNDYDTGMIEQDLAKFHTWAQGSGIPGLAKVAEVAGKFKQWNDKKLWYDLHGGLKMFAWHELRKDGLEHDPQMDEAAQKKLKTDVASYLNDVTGGMDMNKFMWATPKARQLMHLFMFAPDWTISNIVTAGLGKSLGYEYSEYERNQLLKHYWPAMLTTLVVLPNLFQAGIYAALGGGDPDDRAFSLSNEDEKQYSIDITPITRKLGFGDKRYYMRYGKQAWEIAGWLNQPLETLMGKTSLAVKTAFEQVTGTNTSGWKMPFKDEGFWESIVNGTRVSSVASKFLPMSLSSLWEGKPSSFFAPVSTGMTAAKAEQRVTDILTAYADPQTWDEIRGQPEYEKNLAALVPDVLEAARRNGLDPHAIVQAGKRYAITKYYGDFFKALNKGDKKQMEQAAESVIRLGGALKGFEQSMTKKLERQGQSLSPDQQQAIQSSLQAAQSRMGINTAPAQ